MKKGVFASAFLALLLMTNFVSAAFHYGFGGGFVDWPTLVLNISIFFILFALINWSLARTRIFHGGTLTVLSLASAFITYYYGFYRTDFHVNISRYFGDLLFNFGLSGDFIFPILSFIVIIILVLLARKIGLHGVLIGLGLFMIGLASLTDIFYEDFTAFIMGFILLFIGLWLWWRRRKKRQLGPTPPPDQSPSPTAPSQQPQQTHPTVQQIRKDKNKLARKLGINKLQKEAQKLSQELQNGFQRAGNLSSQATSLGWTKSGRTNPRKGETDSQYQKRVKEANKIYKNWYRQYSKNIADEKRLKEIEARINHLQSKI